MPHKNFITVLVCVTCIITASCTSTQNICKTYERKSGEIIYAIPSYNHTRKVHMLTDEGLIIIYGVPLEQPLINIPVCKYKGSWYWVMP
jgi:hypothetical protein